MVTRRKWLLGIVGALGIGAGAYKTNNTAKKNIDEAIESTGSITGPPPTDTKIGEVTARNAVIKRVEFYQSGAAIIYPKSSHGCYDGFALHHQQTSLGYDSDGSYKTTDALDNWNLGSFDEPITIDLAGTISKKSNYPNREFRFQLISSEGGCLSTGDTFDFTAPESAMPDKN